MSSESPIPSEFEERFAALLKECEVATGKTLKLEISVPFKNRYEISPLNKRGYRYRVTMTDPKYKDLNGEYDSIDDINHEINSHGWGRLIEADAFARDIRGVYTGGICPYKQYGTLERL